MKIKNMKKTTSMIFSVTLAIMIVILAIPVFTMNVFAIGNYGVNLDNSAYKNKYSHGQCTWYCWGRAMEKCGVNLTFGGNARDWDNNAASAGFVVNTTPSDNCIAVWESGKYGHVAFVERYSPNETSIYISESNISGMIYADGWLNLSSGRYGYMYNTGGKTGSYVRGNPDHYIHLVSNRAPIGSLDGCEMSGGKLHVWGWALDEDNLSSQLQVQINVGGEWNDAGAEHKNITANTLRKDIGIWKNCGDYHGFDAYLSTGKTGWQTVIVYIMDATDLYGNHNTRLIPVSLNLSSTPTTTKPTTKKAVMYGDVNSDENINSADVLALRKYVAKRPIKISLPAADCNNDGKINSLDILLLRKYVAKWKVKLGP